MRDWAQDVVYDIYPGDNEAEKRFCECYAQGDTDDAWERYRAAADKVVGIAGGATVLVFGDGSAYCDADRDRFYGYWEAVPGLPAELNER